MVTPLDRNQVDSIVRRLEGKAYRVALGSSQDPEQAASLLIQAFGQIAPYLPRDGEEQRERRLDSALRTIISRNGWLDEANTMAADSVPEGLHVRLVDLVEERQNDEPLARRKRFFGAVALALLIGIAGGYLLVRWNALQAAHPVVVETSLGTNRDHVSTQGSLYVRFSRAPASRPTISIQPSGAALDPPVWDGHTILLGYSGLQYASMYTLTVQGEYRSQFSDKAQFSQQWRFTTEGYPIVVKLDPADGNAGVFRYGQIGIDFDKRPPINPVVTLSPPDGGLTSGSWTGATWNVLYAGLKPLTTYRASLVLNYGVPSANIDRTWTFTTEVGAPPKGVPVLWYSTGSRNNLQPDEPQRFVAMNWNGELVGTSYLISPLRQTWDGSAIADQTGAFQGVNGNPIPSTKAYPAVAEDSQTLCELAGPPTEFSTPSPTSLYVGSIGGQLRRVGPVALPGNSGYGLIACSVGTHRAIVIESAYAGVASVTVIALDTARVLYRQPYATFPTQVVASRDCRYIAEQSPIGPATAGTVATVIRRVSDGSVVARLMNQSVIAFSWDDRRVVTQASPGSTSSEVDLVDWQSGRVLWRNTPVQTGVGYQPAYAAARPNGSEMAIALGPQSVNGDVDQLWIVGADGAGRKVLSGTFYSLFFFTY